MFFVHFFINIKISKINDNGNISTLKINKKYHTYELKEKTR